MKGTWLSMNGEAVEPSEPLVFLRLLQPWLNECPGSVVGVFPEQAERLIESGVALPEPPSAL